MIESQLAKVGIVGILVGAVWALGLGVERMGGQRLIDQEGREGALVPEVPEEIQPIIRGIKRSAFVSISVPKVQSIDPGSIRIATPGYNIDDAKVKPVTEIRKVTNPKPRSILVLLDNSNSMFKSANGLPASDPDYRRLDACRDLLESLQPNTDRVILASFPCRRSTEDWSNRPGTTRPFEMFSTWTSPVQAEPQLDTLREQENGSTPLYRAIQQASQVLAADTSGNQKILVVLTDGKDTDMLANGEEKAIQAIKASGAETYAIGLGPAADTSVLGEMTPHVLKADDAQALNRAFRQILLQMSREVVQIDLDLMVGRVGAPIPAGEKVEVTFRSGGKLYKATGRTQG